MIELTDWIGSVSFPAKPWLVLGKGPTFSHRADYDLTQYNLLSLNHAVREQKVDVAHIIDLDVVKDCGAVLLDNCRWLLMPRRPHVQFAPSQAFLLEDFVQATPVLRELDAQGRLVWYNLANGAPVDDSPPIGVKYFSSEAALNLLARMGARTVRSLGLDGGRGYSPSFRDLQHKTHLAGGHASYDAQFAEMQRIIQQHRLDYAPLVEPLRVFVGTDEASMIGTRVLQHSIRQHASCPVEVVPMLNVPVPMPKDPANRPRTGFSFSRFLIPKLCGYRGKALYLDSDMQVFADLAELWRIPFGHQKVLCTNQPEPPDAWKGNPAFHPGRQMSVMLLDCSRLDWDIDDIVRGLDEKKFTYQQLMFDLCLVKPDEIADRLPPEWNCLEHYEPGQTKLLHYTVATFQPWKNDDNPLREIWMECYREAIACGAITPAEITEYLRAGFVKPALAEELAHAPRPGPVQAPTPTAGPDVSLAERLQAAELALRGAQHQNTALEQLRAANDEARRDIQRLQDEAGQLRSDLAALRRSWSWKMGRVLTQPLRLVKTALRGPAERKSA